MSRPVFSFRPNPENPEHQRAWEILSSVPEGQKNLFLVRAILQEDLAQHLEKLIRKAVREELEGIQVENVHLSDSLMKLAYNINQFGQENAL